MEAHQLSATSRAPEDAPSGAITVLVLTHNRVHLLPKCVENVVRRASPATHEILIWDNASTDGTAEYLDGLDDPRIRVVHSEKNIGFNAYAEAVAMTTGDYLVELDDDVVDAPEHWDLMLRDAYERLPKVGFLAADTLDDPLDEASYLRHHVRPHEYVLEEENGVRLLRGPAGGACAITSRELNERVGGFRRDPTKVFWLEDQAYIQDIIQIGYEAAVLADLVVHHTGGPHYTVASPEKDEFWAKYWKRRDRRLAIKKLVFKVPFFGRLNARFGWFQAP
jgi:GT2 family glycosyltransferase